MSSLALRVTVLLLACAPALAQFANVPRESFGVTATTEGARAMGPDYAAHFDGRGMEFVPALGQRAAALHPVRFTLDEVRRGATTVFARGDAELPPIVRDNTVRYLHRADLTEVYDVRRDGIEQSFVFATRPAGHGDLVVRGLVTTDLTMVAASDDGVRYEGEGLGGVSFGAVTGIDANGASARGSIRVVGDHVEWVLPAAFVDGAAYPMVLDPLVGTVFTISFPGGDDDVAPSIAYDDTTNRYLVVWLVRFASTGNADEIRGQFLTDNGSPSGFSLFVADTTITSRPSVANVNGTSRFVVTYQAMDSFWGPEVNVLAVDGNGVAAGPQIANGSDLVAAIGGDSRGNPLARAAVVAFQFNQPWPWIATRALTVPASGGPVLAGPLTYITALTSPVTHVSITAHGGSAARWLVTWAETAGSTSSIRGTIVDAIGAMCSPVTTLHSATAGSVLSLPVSASPDGAEFLVAWQRVNGSIRDVQFRRVDWSGTCGSGLLTLGTVTTLPGGNLHEAPALAFAKDRYLLAWRDRVNAVSLPRIMATCISRETNEVCGTEWLVSSAAFGEFTPVIAARYTAGDTASNRAMISWSDDDVRGHEVESHGTGTVVDLGGGCAGSALENVPGWSGDPVIGSTDFAFTLGNPTAPVLALILGLSSVSVPCGGCTIVPSLDILLPGNTPNPLPLPCDTTLIGVDVWAQWLLLKPSTCPILPDFSFSRALKFTIGE